MSLVTTSDKLYLQWGSNPLLAKNGHKPVVSEAGLFIVNSANGNHSD
jgi:hypothetical protein